MNDLKRKRKLVVIDFEVLSKAKFWMCCMKDLETGKKHKVINNPDELKRIYNKNKDTIWIGYNIKGYDQWIYKAILANINPFQVSEAIIGGSISPWKISDKMNKIPLVFFEIGMRDKGLKELELFMGESIQESTVPFTLERYPNPQEIAELTEYCFHDVEMTSLVFEESREDYDSHEFIIDYYKLSESSFKKTQAQLSSYVLGAKKPSIPRNDEFDFKIIDTIQLDKYKFVLDWYNNYENRDYSKSLKVMIYGTITEFGWGGMHAAKKQYKAEGFIRNSDGESFYPSEAAIYGLLSRNIEDTSKFIQILDTRRKLKAIKDKKQKPFKLLLNVVYGASKDPNNELYDPQMANAICVNGQLLLLDLIEKVEKRFGDTAEFIQGNTDGVMFNFATEEDVNEYYEICKEWCDRTKIVLEHDIINKVIQKDVNNYVFVEDNGSIKSKGAYIKKLSKLDYDLPIVNKAVRDYLLYGTSVRETIQNENKLIEFQKCVKLKGNYKYITHNGERKYLKVYRVFASKSFKDGPILKVKNEGNPEKIGNTPGRAFIINDNIKNCLVPDNLDKEWYISLAEKRVEEFLPNCHYEYTLFDLIK